MGINLHSDLSSHEIGAASFFNCFFSTVAVNLERNRRGSRFPVLMRGLYEGRVSKHDIDALRKELQQVRDEFAKLPPTAVVWDEEDRSKQPPWGDNISDEITDLGNYFVTSDGKDLFSVMVAAIDDSEIAGGDLWIE